MTITDIRFKRIQDDSKMKAIVSITFDGVFVVHDIKIIEGNEKLFLAMPSRRMQDGNYRDIAHPINPETRAQLENEILAKYHEMLEQQAAEGAAEITL